MGWTFTQGYSKKDLIAELLGENSFSKVLRHACYGNELWSVREITKDCGLKIGDRIIVLDLLACHKGNWGSKPMDESMGPYFYKCPVKYLDMVPEVRNAEWRKKVLEYQAKERKKRQASRERMKNLCNWVGKQAASKS